MQLTHRWAAAWAGVFGASAFGWFPLVLAQEGTPRESDPRQGANDPWVRDLPDASELVSGNLGPNFPELDVRPDGTLGGSPAAEPGGANGAESPSSTAQDSGPGGGRTPAVAASESEPNNDFGTAQSVSSSSRISATIAPQRDYDWFGFDLTRRGTLEVTFTQVPAPLNLSFRVYNGNGSAITGWMEPKGQGGGTVMTPIHLKTKGRYYVVVADGQNDAQSTSPYELQLDFIAGDRFEPNESFGAKTAVSDQARLLGTILPQGDYDCYGFTLERRGSMEVWFREVPAEIEPSFRVYNAEGSAITGWISPPVRDNAAEPVVIDFTAAGAYHIAVADAKGDAYSEKPYRLDLRMHPGDPFEANDSIGTATTVQATGAWQASLLPKGDYDVYRFEVPNQGISTVRLSSVPSELLPSLRLYNAEGSALTGWRKTVLRDARSEPLVFDLAGKGTYYVSIANDDSQVRSFDPFDVAFQYDAGDAHEPNAGIGQATIITRGAPVSGSILPKGDYDHYRFEVANAGKVAVTFSTVPKTMTPSVRFLNANGSAITGWKTPAIRDGASAPVEVDISTPGRYYVVIADNDGQAFGVEPYRFQVQ